MIGSVRRPALVVSATIVALIFAALGRPAAAATARSAAMSGFRGFPGAGFPGTGSPVPVPGSEGPAVPLAQLPGGRVPAPPSAAVAAASAAGSAGCVSAPYGANFYAPPLGRQSGTIQAGGPKTVALTFDDGPGPATGGVISVLRRYGVTGTFLNIGQNAAVRPGLVRAEAADGYLVGNHTWNHPDMNTLSSSAQATELDQASAEQEKLIGWAPCVFRPPYGNYDNSVLALTRQRRMATWLWSVDTEDWKAAGSSSAYWVKRIIKLAESEGGVLSHPVILMHNAASGDPATVAALPAIIRYFRDRGYTFVNLAGATEAGYRVLTSGGGVASFGAAGYGRADVSHGRARAVSEATDPDTGGYWVLRSDGGVSNVHAPWYGSLAGRLGKGRHAVAIAADRGGYLVLTSNGGITPFGARWYGSAAGKLGGRGQARAVGLAVDAATGGYWILTSSGSVLNFHAPWYGSLAGRLRAGEEATAIAASAQGGYLLLTSAGRVRADHATGYGQVRGRLGHGVTAVGLAVAPATDGYLMLLSNGGVLNFHTRWHGSVRGKIPARQAVTAIAGA